MPVLFIGSGVVASREILKEGTFSPVFLLLSFLGHEIRYEYFQPIFIIVVVVAIFSQKKKKKKSNSSVSSPIPCLKARVRFLILPSALLIFFSVLFPSYHNIFRLDHHPLSPLLFSSLFIFSPLFFFSFSSPLPEGFVCNHPLIPEQLLFSLFIDASVLHSFNAFALKEAGINGESWMGRREGGVFFFFLLQRVSLTLRFIYVEIRSPPLKKYKLRFHHVKNM